MGATIKVSCTACRFYKELNVGSGLMDCQPEFIMKRLNENEKNKFRQVLDMGAIRTVLIQKACVCGSCGELYSVKTVNYYLNNKSAEIRGVCPKCSSAEVRFIDNAAPCPVCGEELTFQKTGFWD
ncbi:MAG: hypothetical protein IJ007_08850 [Oscillospiraceae bacterium]|nr:hypothetical protein [Oscillospiraceae bacterium]